MIKKPLVLTNGQLEQLQAGDTLALFHTLEVVNGEATPALIGVVVYIDSANTIKFAKADSDTTKNAIAMCQNDINPGESGAIQINSLLTLTTAQWDTITGDIGGLTPGSVYYLSNTAAGWITKIAPTTGYVVKIGIAVSAIDFEILVGTPIKL